MPRPKPRRAKVRESEPVLETATQRDFVMARLAAGRSATADALTALDEAIALFANPGEDRGIKKRKENVDLALEALGIASRAVECAEEALPGVDADEGEPWEEDDEDDLDDEDEDDFEDDDGNDDDEDD